MVTVPVLAIADLPRHFERVHAVATAAAASSYPSSYAGSSPGSSPSPPAGISDATAAYDPKDPDNGGAGGFGGDFGGSGVNPEAKKSGSGKSSASLLTQEQLASAAAHCAVAFSTAVDLSGASRASSTGYSCLSRSRILTLLVFISLLPRGSSTYVCRRHALEGAGVATLARACHAAAPRSSPRAGLKK